jgi:capsid protein
MNDRTDVSEAVIAGFAVAFNAIHGNYAGKYAAARAALLSANGDVSEHERMTRVASLIEQDTKQRAA